MTKPKSKRDPRIDNGYITKRGIKHHAQDVLTSEKKAKPPVGSETNKKKSKPTPNELLDADQGGKSDHWTSRQPLKAIKAIKAKKAKPPVGGLITLDAYDALTREDRAIYTAVHGRKYLTPKQPAQYNVVGGLDCRQGPAKVMEIRYEKPEQPKAETGYHPRPGARPTIYVPREMTEAEHTKHLAEVEPKTTQAPKTAAQIAFDKAYEAAQAALESDPKHIANITKIRLYEAEQAKVKAAPTSAAFKWSHAQVICEKPLRKVIVEKLDDGQLHIVFIRTDDAKQIHTHFKVSKEAAQSLHDLFELAGCTPVKTPMALEMTFEVPQEPTRGMDA